MTAGGVDFLESWIAMNVNGETKMAEARALATRCLAEASTLGLTQRDIEANWGSVEQTIRDAIEHLAQPGAPGD